MSLLLSIFASLLCLLHLQVTVPPVLASHVVSRRQSEFVDVLWSGRLNEPYLTAHILRAPNSHVLCHSPSGPVSLVFSRGPSGATYGFASVNTSVSSEAAVAYSEQLPTLSARHQRSGKTKGTVKLNIVLTDAETAKRVSSVKSSMLFTSAQYQDSTRLDKKRSPGGAYSNLTFTLSSPRVSTEARKPRDIETSVE
ncbi:hypothetical protein GSI_08614 [Ganoderma sinense ZZ0214-1]|uniref:Uncharacterized protein n=1 Tax=Ganoderma sinense ZZ0214-1 TaxID=1077348 RepID=A0A2G8S464_9APHY|nr:hypothetical protein GSI_08614 [Ganoderma sinense ZZ0214-1]